MAGTPINLVSNTTMNDLSINEQVKSRDDHGGEGHGVADPGGRLEEAVARAMKDFEAEGRLLWSQHTPAEAI